MQYQVFIQSQPNQRFVASIVGMPAITGEGTSEEDAIAQAKTALQSQLAGGKFVTIEVNLTEQLSEVMSMKYAGIFADDSTFEDWMEKLATIRREANATEAER